MMRREIVIFVTFQTGTNPGFYGENRALRRTASDRGGSSASGRKHAQYRRYMRAGCALCYLAIVVTQWYSERETKSEIHFIVGTILR
jgi:hypothetical protein